MTTPTPPSGYDPDQPIPPPPPPAPFSGTINTGPDAIPQTQPANMPPVAAYPPGYQPGAADAPATRPPAPAPRLGAPVGAIVAIVAVILIAAIIGVGLLAGKNGSGPLAGIFATPVPTATSTPVPPTATATSAPTASPTSSLPPAPTGFAAYTDPTGSYALYYPSTWTALPTTQQGIAATVFISSDQQNFALVASNGSQIPPSQYVAVIQAIVQAVGQSVSNVKVISGPTSVQAGANTWTQIKATLTFQGKPYSAAIYGTDHGGATTFFVELAPTATFDATNTAAYTTMLNSFMFLK